METHGGGMMMMNDGKNMVRGPVNKMKNGKATGPSVFFLFSSAIWLSHGQLWTIIEGTSSLNRC